MTVARRQVLFDDAGVTFDAGRGHAVRVDQHDDGWLVRSRDRAPAFFSAGPHGLHAAATAVRALALQGPRRPVPQRHAADLFTRDVATVDVDDVGAVHATLLHAWIGRARSRQPSCAPLFDGRATPRALVLCGAPAFLDDRWLVADALRFRAARAVFVDVDGLTDQHPSLPLVERLHAARDWRRLLCADGAAGVRRALHATIEMISASDRANGDLPPVEDDAVDARLDDDIRALRFLSLVRPVPGLRHLALLGEMVRAVPRAHRPALGPRLALVQLASHDELDEILDEAHAHFGFDDEPMLVHSLATLLVRGTDVPVRGGARALARAAFATLLTPTTPRVREPEDVPVQEPPIPAPRHPGITFLSTTMAIFREGARMHHCVATRIPDALDGSAFLFHVEHAGARATIEVDSDGDVVEAQGPCNRDNAAARYARAVFARWGLGFALAERAERDGCGPALPLVDVDPPPLHAGERLIATLAELLAVLPFIATTRAHLAEFLRVLLPAAAEPFAATNTHRWFAVEGDDTAGADPRFTLVALDDDGCVTGWLGPPPRSGRRAAGLRGDANARRARAR